MQMKAIAALLLASGVDARHSAIRGNGFLSASSDLQPQRVASTLAQVEGEWKNQATEAAECNVDAASDAKRCALAKESFMKSCGTVVSAIVDASSGDRASVKEYMGDVCQQDVLQAWQKEHCGSFAQSIDGGMSDDSYDNRMNFDTSKMCNRYWKRFSEEQEQRLKKEKADREAEEKRLAEERAEAEKKAAEKAAAEKKRQQEEEKKRQEEEAKHKVEEVARQAEEAKKKAEEAKQQAEEAKKKAAVELAEKSKEAEQKVKQAEEAKKEADAKVLAQKKLIINSANSTNSTKVKKEMPAASSVTSNKTVTAKK